MQISEAWLRDLINPAISTQELVEQLTMAGLEVDSVQPVAAEFSGVVVGEVLALTQHPDADRLRVCQVAVGETEPLQIVCGASNVRAGLKIPAALIGAVLPGDFKIKKSKLRGVESFGMLCSEKELGMAAESQGLMELPPDAPVGANIRDYLALDDSIIEVDLTPNRADCLSVEGLAREVAALNGMDFADRQSAPVAVKQQQTVPVQVMEPQACPSYLGRVISGVNSEAETPFWMQERLRRSGLRSLGPLVDATNYVLLELGQPLHAFDADKLQGGIQVRYARQDEPISLLNGQTITLDGDTLIISDHSQALAVAGIMGGNDTAVSETTTTIFLECAFFSPEAIAGKARRYGLHTDSSHRFERGVDPTLQQRAIERASQLILAIAGGEPGPIVQVTDAGALPKRQPVLLRQQRLEKMLGMALTDAEISAIFHRLGMAVETVADGWKVTPPGRRFDIAIEADLIEELARIHGYNNLPSSRPPMRGELAPASETTMDVERLKDLLVGRGYREAITYSFVDAGIQALVAPNDKCLQLKNPISSELSIMRTTLWCGLIKAALHNTNRQQQRVRLFETGLRFVDDGGQTLQEKMLAGLVLGGAHDEQWGEKTRAADFFDIKADVESLFKMTGCTAQFVKTDHSALHPGQSAKILSETGGYIGCLGMLHPSLEKQLGFESPVFLFELRQDLLLAKRKPAFKPLSKFPSVRRDLALLVKEEISAGDIIATVRSIGEPLLKEVAVFDVYRGKGIEEGHKSAALSLVLQNDKQTLTDNEIDAIVNNVLETLTKKISAKLRD